MSTPRRTTRRLWWRVLQGGPQGAVGRVTSQQPVQGFHSGRESCGDSQGLPLLGYCGLPGGLCCATSKDLSCAGLADDTWKPILWGLLLLRGRGLLYWAKVVHVLGTMHCLMALQSRGATAHVS